MEIVRGASGFGDAIYLKACLDICFKNRSEDIVVLSNFPDVLEGYKCLPYSNGIEPSYDFTYIHRKYKKDTNQFHDMLIQSGFFTAENVKGIEYKLDIYTPPNKACIPTLLTIPPYGAFGNGKGKNGYMTPEIEDYMKLIDSYTGYKKIIIQDKRSFPELCSLFRMADKVVCQQGWGTALAEGLGTQCDIIFTHKALNDDYAFINSITPKKIFTREDSRAIIL